MESDITAGLSQSNRAALAAELLPGETLRWAAEPSSGMRVAGFAIWLVAIPFVGFGLLWTGLTLLPLLLGAPERMTWLGIVAALFGLPFLGVGLIALWKPFSLRKAADNTVFAFTDRRLIRLQHGKTRSVSEVPMESIGSVDMVEYSDGSGTLTIQALGPPEPSGQRRPIVLYQLMGVKDVARARALLRERTAA
ncbi:hypothetical protein P6144_08405 [Sphingomonas sp. HITSZ_GF]|uniref:hypothetical protein n=1 Tax=Sphingomonas sp. HITSZ_GF TaxID=3037247 RepID=UPI00240D1A7D|nr:hypothetical protein [Sphingomonas sp. HITSZ_GF]MDG2533664.1 hypothetical protein [Sphingomonas sp. HITSZ_GF]